MIEFPYCVYPALKKVFCERQYTRRQLADAVGISKSNIVRAQFITVPEEFPGKARGEKLYPIRTGVVTYIHPQRRYVTVAIMVDGKEIKESFRPEEVLA